MHERINASKKKKCFLTSNEIQNKTGSFSMELKEKL